MMSYETDWAEIQASLIRRARWPFLPFRRASGSLLGGSETRFSVSSKRQQRAREHWVDRIDRLRGWYMNPMTAN